MPNPPLVYTLIRGTLVWPGILSDSRYLRISCGMHMKNTLGWHLACRDTKFCTWSDRENCYREHFFSALLLSFHRSDFPFWCSSFDAVPPESDPKTGSACFLHQCFLHRWAIVRPACPSQWFTENVLTFLQDQMKSSEKSNIDIHAQIMIHNH